MTDCKRRDRAVMDLVAEEVGKAVEEYKNVTFRWPNLWLDLYRDPRLSWEENCQRAREAVEKGWRPKTQMIRGGE